MTEPFRTTDTAVLAALKARPRSWLTVTDIAMALKAPDETEAAAEIIFRAVKLEEREKIESDYSFRGGPQFRYKKPKEEKRG